jgi:hypothetical protein
MATPIQNLQVVAQGLARLTSSFITKPNIRAMLAIYLQPFQDIENALFQVLTMRFLGTATLYALPETNPVLDAIGGIIGQPRNGMSDASYQSAIYLRIAVNRSNGRTANWAQFGQILLQRAGAGGPVSYYEAAAGLFFGVWDLATLDPVAIAKILAGAVPNGVYGVFAYSTWPDGNDFEWGSVYSAAAGEGTWSSVYEPAIGGLWVASEAI